MNRCVWFSLAIAWSCGTVMAAAPDTLTMRDKAQINQLAELHLRQYGNILNSITDLSTESDGDAQDLIGLVDGISTEEGRLFYNTESLIQDNIDPDHVPGSPGLDRRIAVYTYDFFMYFKAQGNQPVSLNLLERGEPTINADGLVTTKLLYEVTFNGHHKEKTTPYVKHKREMRFIAEHRGSNDWDVYIAQDDFFDLAKGFVSYQFEQQLKAAEASGVLTSRMRDYQNAEKRAAEEAERVRNERQKNYIEAIEQGDALLAEGDPELAIVMYDRAEKIDPASIVHIIRKKRAVRAYDAKAKGEILRALDSLSADLSRQVAAKHFKSVAVFDFTENDGTRNALGKYLAEQVANRMTKQARGFKVLDKAKEGKAQAVITGALIRSGEENDIVNLTATITNLKRGSREGYAEKEFPLPQGFTAPVPVEATADGTTTTTTDVPVDKQVPPPMNKQKAKRWAFGATAGLNLCSLAADDNTRKFTENGQGLRAGLDVERWSTSGNSRLASGVRYSEMRVFTGAEDEARKIEVRYIQVPLLYRLFSNGTVLGRFGVQAGAVLDFMIGMRTESYVAGEFIDVSYGNAHASPGVCYESPAMGKARIVANASYDLMIGKLSGADLLPTEGPRLNAISFAVGVMF